MPLAGRQQAHITKVFGKLEVDNRVQIALLVREARQVGYQGVVTGLRRV